MKLCLMILSVPWYMFNGLRTHCDFESFFNIHNRKQFQSFNYTYNILINEFITNL